MLNKSAKDADKIIQNLMVKKSSLDKNPYSYSPIW
jgi:hypothetical protein